MYLNCVGLYVKLIIRLFSSILILRLQIYPDPNLVSRVLLFEFSKSPSSIYIISLSFLYLIPHLLSHLLPHLPSFFHLLPSSLPSNHTHTHTHPSLTLYLIFPPTFSIIFPPILSPSLFSSPPIFSSP